MGDLRQEINNHEQASEMDSSQALPESTQVEEEAPITENKDQKLYAESEKPPQSLSHPRRKVSRFTEFLFQVIPLLAGLLLTYALIEYVRSQLSPDDFIYLLIIPAEDLVQRAIPAVIIFIFLWTLIDLALKFVLIHRRNRFLREKRIIELPYQLIDTNKLETKAYLRNLPRWMRGSYLCERLQILLAQLDAQSDKQNVHDHFRHQVDIDSEIAQSSYTTAKVFIWAMPILGFIGTVIGIGMAVGNFSGFLSGDIDNIELVKAELSKVATGLSFAFNTTLLGLVSSLIAMISASFVQKTDELSQKRYETLGLMIITNSENGNIPEVASEIKLTETTHRIAKQFSRHLAVLKKNVDAFGSKIEATASTANDSFQRFDHILSAMEQMLHLQQTTMAQKIEACLSKVDTSLNSGMDHLIKGIESFAKRIASHTEIGSGLLQRIHEITLNLHNSTDQYLGDLVQSTQSAAAAIADVAPAQKVTLQAIDSLNAMNEVLKDLQENQEKLLPLLDKLSGPMELKLVPAQTRKRI